VSSLREERIAMEPDDSNRSWGQRHGLTIMFVVMGAMLALVIGVQVAS
jgi:hypothetical protein